MAAQGEVGLSLAVFICSASSEPHLPMVSYLPSVCTKPTRGANVWLSHAANPWLARGVVGARLSHLDAGHATHSCTTA